MGNSGYCHTNGARERLVVDIAYCRAVFELKPNRFVSSFLSCDHHHHNQREPKKIINWPPNQSIGNTTTSNTGALTVISCSANVALELAVQDRLIVNIWLRPES